MGIGASIFLIALGAVLAFAVDVPASGVNLDVVGLILMAVGFMALLYTLLWWSDAAPWRRNDTVVRTRRRYVESPVDDDLARPRPVVREREVIEYEERAS